MAHNRFPTPKVRLLLGLAMVLAGCQAAPARVGGAAPAAGPPTPPAESADGPRVTTTIRLPEPTRLVYGSPRGVAFAPYIALERGYFADVNIDLQLEAIRNTAEIGAYLTTGTIDIGHAAAGPGLFNTIGRGLPIKAILDVSHYPPGGKTHLALAPRDLYESGELRDLAQLEGRRVAQPSIPGGLGIDLDRALHAVGLSIGDVEQVQMPFAEQGIALSNGAIDAALTVEPFGSKLVASDVARVLLYLDDAYPGHQIAVALIGSELIERPEVVRAFTLAYLRGVRDYERARRSGESVDQIAAAIAKHNGLDPALVASLFRNGGMTALDPNGHVNSDSVQYDLQWYRDHGAIEGDVDLSAFVDPRYASEAAELLGPFR